MLPSGHGHKPSTNLYAFTFTRASLSYLYREICSITLKIELVREARGATAYPSISSSPCARPLSYRSPHACAGVCAKHGEMRLLSVLVLLHSSVTSAALGKSVLTKSLGSTARPVVIHLWDPEPKAVPAYAVEDVSKMCRDAGAHAVLVAPEFIGTVAEEQEANRGGFPGPLPVIADCTLDDLVGDKTAAPDMAALGAKAVGIRYYEADWPETGALEEALRSAVATAEQSGMSAVLLADKLASYPLPRLTEGLASEKSEATGVDADAAAATGGLASRVGADAGLVATAAEYEGGDALPLGCWDGSDSELDRLRDAGFSAPPHLL